MSDLEDQPLENPPTAEASNLKKEEDFEIEEESTMESIDEKKEPKAVVNEP